MRVLLVNSLCGKKSTGRICSDLADVLKSKGDECRIAFGRDVAPEQYDDISLRIGSRFDFYFDAFKTRILGSAGSYSKKATSRFIETIKSYKPDIIHLHNIHGYYINIGLLFEYIKQSCIPVVWTLHDCWAFTGHCSHFSIAGCNQWKGGCEQCIQSHSYPTCWFKDDVNRNYFLKKETFSGVQKLVIVTPSKWLADVVRQSFLKEYPIKYIYNGVDLKAFSPTCSDIRYRYGINDKSVVLGVASSWNENKGFNDFMKLSEMLPEQYQIVMIGLSKRQLERLPQNIIGLECTDSIHELAAFYSVADVFVNPSREETMGLVTVEATACGTPAVVYNETAVPETVDDTCGIVVQAGDIVSLKNAIIEVVEKHPFSSEKCVAHAKKYEKVKQYEKYINLYQQMLNR